MKGRKVCDCERLGEVCDCERQGSFCGRFEFVKGRELSVGGL